MNVLLFPFDMEQFLIFYATKMPRKIAYITICWAADKPLMCLSMVGPHQVMLWWT